MIANKITPDEIRLQIKRTERQMELEQNKIRRLERDGDPRGRLPFHRDQVERMGADLATYDAELLRFE